MKSFRAKTPIIKCSTDGVRETLYTCPPNCRAQVPLVYIVNAGGVIDVTFEIYKADTETHFYILSSKNFASGEFLQLSDSYIVLEPGDKLEVTCDGTTPDVDAFCTVEETFNPVG